MTLCSENTVVTVEEFLKSVDVVNSAPLMLISLHSSKDEIFVSDLYGEDPAWEVYSAEEISEIKVFAHTYVDGGLAAVGHLTLADHKDTLDGDSSESSASTEDLLRELLAALNTDQPVRHERYPHRRRSSYVNGDLAELINSVKDNPTIKHERYPHRAGGSNITPVEELVSLLKNSGTVKHERYPHRLETDNALESLSALLQGDAPVRHERYPDRPGGKSVQINELLTLLKGDGNIRHERYPHRSDKSSLLAESLLKILGRSQVAAERLPPVPNFNK